MGDTELTRALMVNVEELKKEILRLRTREFILTTALECIRTVSINRVDDVFVGFIDHMLALEPDHEKD